MEKGTLASDVLTQELGILLTSEFAQGEASVTLLSSSMSSGKAALKKGVMVEKAQPGLGLASDVGRGTEMTCALCGPRAEGQSQHPAARRPPISHLLPRFSHGMGRLFPTKRAIIG